MRGSAGAIIEDIMIEASPVVEMVSVHATWVLIDQF